MRLLPCRTTHSSKDALDSLEVLDGIFELKGGVA